MTEDSSQIQYVKSNFQRHTFAADVSDKKIVYQVIKMQDSLLLYINDKEKLHFNDLSVAMTNRYESIPIGTRLIGNFTEELSKSFACRVSKKLKKVVFVSCNLQQDRLVIPLVEKRLYEEIKNNPDWF